MAKSYKIRDGYSFRDDKNEVHLGGAYIALEDDVAKLHAHKLEEIIDDAAPDPSTDGAAAEGE